MRFAKQVALVMFAVAVLLPVATAASEDRGNSAIAHELHKKDKDNAIPVPEPSTLVLLGAAAGAFGVRKMWRQRRRNVAE